LTRFIRKIPVRPKWFHKIDPSFGLDPDAPVFLTGYGPGGLPSHSSQPPKRPDSALQVQIPRNLIPVLETKLCSGTFKS
jgi:hypothetical protein